MATGRIELVISETQPAFSKNTGFVFDWDDTLMLTNWCVARGLKFDAKGVPTGVTSEMIRLTCHTSTGHDPRPLMMSLSTIVI